MGASMVLYWVNGVWRDSQHVCALTVRELDGYSSLGSEHITQLMALTLQQY